MNALGLIVAGLNADDAVIAALLFALAMGVSTCFFAVSVSRRGYGALRNSLLIASAVLCGLSIGFAVFIWLVIDGAG